MGNIFGTDKTFKEIVREQKRMVEKSLRGLEREKVGMEKTEQTLINDIKKAAKAGQNKQCKIMAKDLVRTRKHREKFINLCAQLRVMSLQMSEVGSQAALAESMKNVTRAMMSLNRQMNMPELKNTLMEFQKQSELMEMKQEMMDDVMSDVLDDDTEAESEEVVQAVLDEIGINFNESLINAPTDMKVQSKEVQKEKEPVLEAAGNVGNSSSKPAANDEFKELEERLNKLKK